MIALFYFIKKLGEIVYDEIIKTISVTSDEIDLLITLLEDEIDNCLSVGAEITVNELLEKLK